MEQAQDIARLLRERIAPAVSPALLARVLAMASPRAPMFVGDFAEIVRLDPWLTRDLLARANAPSMNTEEPALHADQAIGLLGPRAARLAALCALGGMGGWPIEIGWSLRGLWRRGAFRAIVARALTHASDFGQAEMAFTAGILLETTPVTLARHRANEWAALERRQREAAVDRDDRDRLEAELFGAPLAGFTARALRESGAPGAISDLIESALIAPGREPPAIARCLAVADHAALAWWHGDEAAALGIARRRAAAERLIPDEAWSDIETEIDLELSHCLPLLGGVDEVVPPDDLDVRLIGVLAELSLESEQENRDLKRRQNDLLHRVTTDQLTGVKNRAAFDERLEEELERACRTGDPLVLLLADLDDFKQINDQLGHLAGDLILRAVAESIERSGRRFDLVARYGGEEFAIIAPQCGHQGAESLAERVRRAVESTRVTWGGKPLGVTVSLGGAVARWPDRPRSAAALVEATDARLYEAKHSGKNCVRIEPIDTAWAVAS